MKKFSLVIIVLLFTLLLSGCNNSERDVSISLPSGAYYGEQHVTLSCLDPNAQITYTLDGSDPGTSPLIYDKETGLTISYSSDLKATAGNNVAEAHYDIVPYPAVKDPTAQAYYDMIKGTYSTDASDTDTFSIKNSTVTFVEPGLDKLTSGYLIKDVNGYNAVLVYTSREGNNVEVPVGYNPDSGQIAVNNKIYTNILYYWWSLEKLILKVFFQRKTS